ncbi:hypothetical protein N7U49_44620 [Streptomyces sp. AD2-2]|nr:hypothetical protein N7U49_44620 [Streptomyces sp. AD2-2]
MTGQHAAPVAELLSYGRDVRLGQGLQVPGHRVPVIDPGVPHLEHIPLTL